MEPALRSLFAPGRPELWRLALDRASGDGDAQVLDSLAAAARVLRGLCEDGAGREHALAVGLALALGQRRGRKRRNSDTGINRSPSASMKNSSIRPTSSVTTETDVPNSFAACPYVTGASGAPCAAFLFFILTTQLETGATKVPVRLALWRGLIR